MIIFFTSPIGLGHATRDLAICEKLCSLKREEVFFVSGWPAIDIFSKNGYVAYNAYKPHKFNVSNSMELRSVLKWVLQYLLYYRKCKGIASDFIDKNKNGLIVSDEDFASISIGENRNRKRILITDLIGTKFVKGLFSNIEVRMNRSLLNMIKKCDRVIIPDYGENKDNISHVGPIVRNLSTSNRSELRKKFGMQRQTVLVSIGGTAAGKYLIEMAIRAHKKLIMKMDVDMIVAYGPSLYKNGIYESKCKPIGFVNNLHEYVYAADLIISLAGRSTMDESIVYGTPGIFIPVKNHFEQEENAGMLGYTYDDIFRLEHLIEEKIGTGGDNRTISPDGAEMAAKIILQMLE